MTTKIKTYNEIHNIVKKLKEDNKTIAFKTGCFDILHIGHLRTIQSIKEYSDILIIGVGSDLTVSTLKGANRPIFTQNIRAEMVAGIECVDYVLILNEQLKGSIDHEEALSVILPNFYSLPNDDKSLDQKILLAKSINTQSIAVMLEQQSTFIKDCSTSTILNKVIAS
jgi:cytidyltransferase-like protein